MNFRGSLNCAGRIEIDRGETAKPWKRDEFGQRKDASADLDDDDYQAIFTLKYNLKKRHISMPDRSRLVRQASTNSLKVMRNILHEPRFFFALKSVSGQ